MSKTHRPSKAPSKRRSPRPETVLLLIAPGSDLKMQDGCSGARRFFKSVNRAISAIRLALISGEISTLTSTARRLDAFSYKEGNTHMHAYTHAYRLNKLDQSAKASCWAAIAVEGSGCLL